VVPAEVRRRVPGGAQGRHPIHLLAEPSLTSKWCG
jgi:hypothetical protein